MGDTYWLIEPMQGLCEAADGGRTRDLKLGKLALYQLSYRRAAISLANRAVGRQGCGVRLAGRRTG
jgi:hypothetical protein